MTNQNMTGTLEALKIADERIRQLRAQVAELAAALRAFVAPMARVSDLGLERCEPHQVIPALRGYSAEEIRAARAAIAKV